MLPGQGAKLLDMQATYIARSQRKCTSVSCRLFNLLMLSGFTRLPLASLGFTPVQQRAMSTNAQACHAGCSICWCCPASLGFPWRHSSATACRQRKCASMSCRLFNLLMLSGFTRLPLASLGFTQVQQRAGSTNAQACHVGCSIC